MTEIRLASLRGTTIAVGSDALAAFCQTRGHEPAGERHTIDWEREFFADPRRMQSDASMSISCARTRPSAHPTPMVRVTVVSLG